MLTPEDLKQITDSITEKLKSSIVDDVRTIVTEVVDARVNPLVEEQEEFFTRFTEQYNPEKLTDSFIDNLIAEADELQTDDEDEEESDYSEYADDEDDDDYETPSNKLSQQEIATMRENEALKARLEALEKQNAENARRAQLKELEANALSVLSGKVIPGTEKQVITLLTAQGLVQEDGNGYVVTTRDRLGEIKKPLAEVVDTLLENNFKHFVPAREGTGSGATNGTNATPVSLEIAPEDISKAVNDPVKLAELTQQFAASLQQQG